MIKIMCLRLKWKLD